MVTELRVYFEGDSQLKPGLHAFLSDVVDAARRKRCRFDLIATNGTPVADYHDALKSHPDAWNVLLLDSEQAIAGSLADFCGDRGLQGCDEHSIFWMVQLMECWFVADVLALKDYYDGGFNESALPRNPEVERISKGDVLSGLKRATKNSKRGEYHKTKHARQLLEKVSPGLVSEAAPNCKRMFQTLLRELSGK
jgi:hypothetical protein